MFGNNVMCRNKACDEGLYVASSKYLCEACFRRQIGDAIHEVTTMLKWAYEKGIDDVAAIIPHVEVN